jgi:Flp pilus assembly protein TadG
MRRGFRRGASALEFALCASALFGLLFAALDWGWLFFRQAQVLQATTQGVRRAATLSREEDRAGAASTYILDNLAEQGVDTTYATVTAERQGAAPSEVLLVDVALPFQPLVGLWPVQAQLRARRSTYLDRQD